MDCNRLPRFTFEGFTNINLLDMLNMDPCFPTAREPMLAATII